MSVIINNPFAKQHICKIIVTYDGYIAYGYVYFKNGNTSADQTFEGKTFDEVVLKIKTMIENL